MRGGNQLAVGASLGATFALLGCLMMGQAGVSGSAVSPPIVGVTGFDVGESHTAVAWEQRGRTLVPVAWGTMRTSVPGLSGGLTPELAFAADRVFMQADRFAEGDEAQNRLRQLASTLIAASNEDTRNRAFTELWEAVKSNTSAHANCPACAQHRADCHGTPEECFGRYVNCVLNNCR